MTQCLGEMRQVGRLLHTSAETAVIIHEWHSHNRLGKNLLLQAPSKEPSWPTEATLAWVNFLNKYHTVLQTESKAEWLHTKAGE